MYLEGTWYWIVACVILLGPLLVLCPLTVVAIDPGACRSVASRRALAAGLTVALLTLAIVYTMITGPWNDPLLSTHWVISLGPPVAWVTAGGLSASATSRWALRRARFLSSGKPSDLTLYKYSMRAAWTLAALAAAVVALMAFVARI